MPGRFYFERHLDSLESEFRKHKSRWDALESQGWKFRTPVEREGQTGIIIFRDNDQHTIYVRSGSAKKTHRELLERCEEYARSSLHQSPQD